MRISNIHTVVARCLALDKSKDAFFVADDDVYFAILVEVSGGDLAANT